MDAAYLRDLLNRCTPIRGAVPQQGDFSEPLAAIYPKALKELAADSLREGRHTLQDFVRQALARNLVKAIPVNDEDAAKFQNVNSPADLS
jgi:molybdopterin-guanine dinucleotide biosynthesis protein A